MFCSTLLFLYFIQSHGTPQRHKGRAQKKRDYLEIIPNRGGGSPQSQNLCYKKYPLNHPKITLKTLKFSYFHPNFSVFDEGLLKRGGGVNI